MEMMCGKRRKIRTANFDLARSHEPFDSFVLETTSLTSLPFHLFLLSRSKDEAIYLSCYISSCILRQRPPHLSRRSPSNRLLLFRIDSSCPQDRHHRLRPLRLISSLLALQSSRSTRIPRQGIRRLRYPSVRKGGSNWRESESDVSIWR